MIHPTVTKVGFEIFQWIKVDESEYKVRVDLDIGWFSFKHIFWCAVLGIPIILVWTIGSPLLAFFLLYRNRNKLNEAHVQKYYLMLYQGLRSRAYYWELINTIRKILMVAINVLMSTLPLTYAALTAVVTLLLLIRIQVNLAPYKLPLNNDLEIEATISGTATLFCGVLFIQDSVDVPEVLLLILIVLIIMNVRFFLFWSVWMLSTFVKKYVLLVSFYNLLSALIWKRDFAHQLLKGKDDEDFHPMKKLILGKVWIILSYFYRIRKR